MRTDNCIFAPNTQFNTYQNDSINSAYYTMIGNQDFIDSDNMPRTNEENKNTFAKSVTRNNTTKFYIKIGTYGRIYNPMGMFSEGKNNKFVAKIGKKEFTFQQVNKGIFDMYLNFLSTKNLAWLNNAEREMI